jgi:hypothetical protein
MTNKDKDIIRLARHWEKTETYTRMIFETILEEQRTLEKPAQGHFTDTLFCCIMTLHTSNL